MKKKYVTFTVRAAYQPKDDTIHLTSKDLDGPWHITLNRGSEAEATLREELVAANLITPAQVGIPERAEYPVNNELPWHQFPVGVTRGNQPVVWDVLRATHALIVGPTGNGKSAINHSLLLHAAQHPQWQVVGIDLKRVEFGLYREVPALAGRFIHVVELENAVEMLRQVHETMTERFNLMSAGGVNDYRDLRTAAGQPPKSVLVLVDEAFILLAPEGAKTDEGRERDLWHAGALQYITELAMLGRAAGIHLAIATQRPDATVMPGSLRSMLEFRMATGQLSPTSSSLTLDSKAATSLPKIRGRGITLSAGGKPQETQFYWASPQTARQLPPRATLT